MIVLWGSALTQIYNDAYRQLMGDKHPIGLGQSTTECWPEVWHLNEPVYRRVWDGESLTFDNQLFPIKRHGYFENAYFTLCYSPVRDESRSVAGVLVTVIETTEQLRAEQALRRSEERLNQVFAQAPVGVSLLRGSDLVYEIVNPSFQEFLPGRALLGRSLLEAVPEVDPTIVAILQRVLKTGEPFVAHEFSVPLDRNQDGIVEDLWFNLVYQPLFEADRSVSGVITLAIDVTAHVLMRQQLEQANDALEEFAHMASHDLQEPLRTMNLYSGLLNNLLGPEATDDQRTFVTGIQEGAERMQHLVKDLLSYCSIVHTDADIASSQVNLETALSKALSQVESRVAETGAVITHSVLPTSRGDLLQLSHVFQNLLSNALKYCKHNEAPKVFVSARQQHSEWVISVADNGIGFEQSQAGRIFGLFKRLHLAAEIKGTGLGLAICKRIIERYGGRMWAESQPGVGSTFFFSLPVVS